MSSNTFKLEEFVLNRFWLIVALNFLASLIYHRNLTHYSSYIPWDFFSDFYKGLVDPALVRQFYASADYVLNFSGNKYITSLLLFISVFKYSMLPMLIFLWKRLSLMRKIAGGVVLAIPLMSGVAMSLSSTNFHYLFVISICFFVLALANTSKNIILEFSKRKFFLFSLVFLFLFSFWQFYTVKSGVSPYQVLVEKQNPIGFEYLKKKNIKFKSDEYYLNKGLDKPSYIDFYEKLTVYLVQGYLGMSIALGEKFQTSYGVGHSVFLQRVFDKHLGFKLGERSFQHKITDRWDEHVQWHSAYSQFANDVGFPGVCVVIFVLGFYFAKVFTWAVVLDDFAAKLLLPLFGILFLYMPANNQVFSFLETMSSFWVLTVLFLMSNKVLKYKNTSLSK